MTWIANIRSKDLEKVEGEIITDQGFFELDVHVDLKEVEASGAPKDFIDKIIAEHIIQCVRTTKIPLREGVWQVTFTLFAQKHFGYPEGFIT